MKFEWNKRYNTYAVYAAAVLAAAVILIFIFLRWDAVDGILDNIMDVCKPLIYAVGIAYILWPLLKFFETKVFGTLEKQKPRKSLSVSCRLSARISSFYLRCHCSSAR